MDKCVGATYQSNPVPTDVEIGPDGDYYVSALPGFPESPGAGKVFKISRTTGAVNEVAGGFTGAVDLAVAADGTIYVAELFAFQVSKVNPGADSASSSVFVPCPTAVEIGPGGTVLAAEGGICQDGPPEGGQDRSRGHLKETRHDTASLRFPRGGAVSSGHRGPANARPASASLTPDGQ